MCAIDSPVSMMWVTSEMNLIITFISFFRYFSGFDVYFISGFDVCKA